jgi:ketosteroid isomerase-like protein
MGRRNRLSSPYRSLIHRSARGYLTQAGIYALALLISGLVACGGNPEADAGAIQALIQKEVEAINTRDLNQLAQIWSETQEIQLFDVPPPGRFRGWDQVARVFNEFFDRFTEIQLTVGEVDIGVEGDLAYASYEWALSGRMGDSAVRDRGQATSIYRREESGWRLVHAHYSPVPAAVALEAAEEEAPADSETPAEGENGQENPTANPAAS